MMKTTVNIEVLEAIKLKKLDAAKALKTAEKEILEVLMEASRFNQSKAAKHFNISRGTMRKKLKEYFEDKYTGER